MSTGIHTADTTDRRRRRRGVVFIKFGLAGAALLGIAAAATSAAWTDQAWFNATATSASVHLQGANVIAGSIDTWKDADTTGTAAVQIPTTIFANLLPGVPKVATIALQNTGSTTLTIAAPVVAWNTGGTFATGTCSLAAVTTVANAPTTLAAATTNLLITVTVTPPSTWPASCQGQTGTLEVSFTGTA